MRTVLSLFLAVIFSTILLALGCQKKTAATNPDPQSKSELPGSTKALQAADLVGYDGTKLRKSVQQIKDVNDRRSRAGKGDRNWARSIANKALKLHSIESFWMRVESFAMAGSVGGD
jgi:hypothetical protein